MRKFALVISGLLIAASAHAQYPNRPIRYIVPFPAGGSADAVARIMSVNLTQAMGQQWLVDNRPGADGVVGANILLKSAADGYTVFFGSNTPMSAAPALRKVPPYDPVKDFTAIGMIGHAVFFLFVAPSVPAKTVSELVEYARANPGKVTYGTGNTGSMVATAQMKKVANLDIIHVPYKGDAPLSIDITAGRIQFAFMQPIPALAQAREGRLRVIATLMPKRSSLMPELPTMAEAGLPGVSVSPWAGLFGPAGIPANIVARISHDLNAMFARADIRENIGKQGFEVQASTPAELTEHTRVQYQTWMRVTAEAGMPKE